MYPEEESGGEEPRHGWIEYGELRKRLGLSSLQSLPQDLFNHKVLTRVQFNDRDFVRFYLSKVCDYAVAHLHLRLHLENSEGFRKKIETLLATPVGQSGISWYARIAENREHLTILDEIYETRALTFLDEYVRIIEEHFPNLKNRFEPCTDGPIGLVVSDPKPHGGTWGFFPLGSPAQGKLQIVDASDFRAFEQTTFDLGCTTIHSGGGSFVYGVAAEQARSSIKRQIKEMIEKGTLNEEKNAGLALEKVISIVYSFPREFGFPPRQRWRLVPVVSDLLPIRCSELLHKVNAIFARVHFADQVVREGIASGAIPVRRNGNRVSYSPAEYLAEQGGEVERRVQEATTQEIPVPRMRISGDFPPAIALENAVKTLRAVQSVICQPLLPGPDKAIDEVHASEVFRNQSQEHPIKALVVSQYSSEQLNRYFETFFKVVLEEYTTIISTCFPTLKDSLPFYKSLPVALEVQLNTVNPRAWDVRIGTKEKQPEHSVRVHLNPDEDAVSLRRSEFDTASATSFDKFFTVYPGVPLDPSVHDHGASGLCIVRAYVYMILQDDMKDLLDAVDEVNS